MDLLQQVFNNFKEVYDGRTETRRRLDSFRNESGNRMGGRDRSGQSSKKAVDAQKNYSASDKRY